jgi:hypothetical protein
MTIEKPPRMFEEKNEGAGGMVPATKAIQDIKDLISSYATTHIRPDINGINRILAGLSLNDYKILQTQVEELYTTPFAEIVFDQHEKILESIDNLVALSISKTLETLITESAGHTKSCVAYYDNGDFMQSAHKMNVTIPDGVNPWVFARVYILTKTTPGENGLYVDGITYTGSDGKEKSL